MQVDSKKELEKLLKVTCEVFIMSVTKSTVEPMLSFITKVTAVRARLKYSSQPTTNLSQLPKMKPLREQVLSQPFLPCLPSILPHFSLMDTAKIHQEWRGTACSITRKSLLRVCAQQHSSSC